MAKSDSAAINKEQPKKVVGKPFVKGQSGNPSGRTTEKVTLEDGSVVSLRELARKHTVTAFKVLVEAMDSADEKVALTAAEAVLSRGWGKAAQAITGEDGEGPVKGQVTINVEFVGSKRSVS